VKALVLSLALLTGCASFGGTPSDAVAYVDNTAQDRLKEIMTIELQAEPIVDYICAVAPQGRTCAYLTVAVNKFYTVAAFIQDELGAGHDVAPYLDALEQVARAIYHAAQTAHRSIV